MWVWNINLKRAYNVWNLHGMKLRAWMSRVKRNWVRKWRKWTTCIFDNNVRIFCFIYKRAYLANALVASSCCSISLYLFNEKSIATFGWKFAYEQRRKDAFATLCHPSQFSSFNQFTVHRHAPVHILLGPTASVHLTLEVVSFAMFVFSSNAYWAQRFCCA